MRRCYTHSSNITNHQKGKFLNLLAGDTHKKVNTAHCHFHRKLYGSERNYLSIHETNIASCIRSFTLPEDPNVQKRN